MTSITVHAPRQVPVPRGATWGAWLFRQASLAVEWVRRARDTRAAQGSHSTRVVDANLLRRQALSFTSTDPGFAADLYSAADRHELAD